MCIYIYIYIHTKVARSKVRSGSLQGSFASDRAKVRSHRIAPRSVRIGSLQGSFASDRTKVRSHRIAPRSGCKHDDGNDDGNDDDSDDDDDGDDDDDDGDDDDDDDVALPHTCFPVRADLRPFVELVPHKLRWRYAEHSWSKAYQV